MSCSLVILLRRNKPDPFGLFRHQYFDVLKIVVSGSLCLGLSGWVGGVRSFCAQVLLVKELAVFTITLFRWWLLWFDNPPLVECWRECLWCVHYICWVSVCGKGCRFCWASRSPVLLSWTLWFGISWIGWKCIELPPSGIVVSML